jgi:hypothetical protein
MTYMMCEELVWYASVLQKYTFPVVFASALVIGSPKGKKKANSTKQKTKQVLQ